MQHAAEICKAMIGMTPAPKWEQVQARYGVRRLGLRAAGLAPLSSDLPTMATIFGDDLTDKRGEAPILREIEHDDIMMEGNDKAGLLDNFTISTNVVTIEPKEKKDKVEINDGG